ncbi:hypothetical protein [Microbacterium karelineae]|uniref:hypothetical protein n=1 Tax=Microbacterium karelineae TaxID=2654283 RepID=UPI0012EA2A59|nr:hypothetical protein [Microbacterium karelineae]
MSDPTPIETIRRPRPWGIWIGLFAMWAVAFPIGPVVTIVWPDVVLGVLYLGVFALPLFWAVSAAAVVGLGALLHHHVRFFRRPWVLILIMAFALATLTALWLGEQAGGEKETPRYIGIVYLLAVAGAIVGLLVTLVAMAARRAFARGERTAR